MDSLELGVGVQRLGSTALNWVWACQPLYSHTQFKAGCGHAEVGFDSLELGVGMQRWGLNWVLACSGGVQPP